MARQPWTLLTLSAVLLGGVCGLLPHLSTSKAARLNLNSDAGQPSTTPGELSIIDKDGKPAGLCPLKHTDVDADIAGYVSRVTVKQQFHNPTSEPIEAVYTFPLPEDAAVDDMTMTIGSRVVKGEIKRKEEAREIYEAAKSAGQSTALLDQERPNIFTQSVANIMPGDEVSITISYVNMLKYDEGKYEFSFPMVVGPRFVPNGGGYTVPGKRGEPSPKPGEADPGPGFSSPNARYLDGYSIRKGEKTVPASDGLPPRVVTDADKITPPITPPGTRAGHDISLRVKLDAGLPLQGIQSVLHDVNIEKKGKNAAVVQLKDEATIPNKDFILRYAAAGSEMQSGVLTTAPGDGSGYFTLILQPPAAPPQSDISPKEMVFVIDQTGSQGGWPIEKAKETMRYALKNMNPRDTFQLIGFNTDVYPCFPKPVPNTPQNVKKALDYLAPIQGNGGTDILKSMDYVLNIPGDPNRLRIVCYMTDGFVGNDIQVLDYVGKHRGSARCFPFGIGNSVNRFLIAGIAKEGRGADDYVTLNTEGQGPAEKFYRRIASPVLLDPQVDWGTLPVADVYPQNIPDVFTAGPIIVKGRYTKPGEGDVVVHGRLRGQPWSQRIHLVLPAVDKDGSAIATLWARDRIEDLQSKDWMGAQTGKPDPTITDKIIQTALDHRLMSQYTSFVAVEQRVVNIGGKSRQVDVPVEMPEGVSYGGIFGENGRTDLYAATAPSGGAMPQVMLKRSAARTYSRGASLGLSTNAVNGPVPPPASKPAQSAAGGFGGGRANHLEALEDKADALWSDSAVFEKELADGSKDSDRKLSEMKPEERRNTLQRIKLAPEFQGLAAKVKAEGKNGTLQKKGLPSVENGQVEVQIWLNSFTAEDRKKLEALGFKLAAELQPKKLILGTLSVEKLDALIELGCVRLVQRPKFK